METRLGFLKRGDFFYFDGIKYEVKGLILDADGKVSCINVDSGKAKIFHIDTDVEVDKH